MITISSPNHALHAPQAEFFRGERVPCFESPSRLDFVLAELATRGHEMRTPDTDSMEVLQKSSLSPVSDVSANRMATMAGRQSGQYRVAALPICLANSHTSP